MSVTVSATPIMLLAGAIQALHETVQKSLNSAKHSNIEFESLNYKLKKLLEENNGQLSEEIVQTVCQEFDTIFLDKNLLIKTLEEHGASDLETEGDTIRCKLECFVLEFDKVNSNNSTSELSTSDFATTSYSEGFFPVSFFIKSIILIPKTLN